METLLSCPWQGWEAPALEFCEESLCAWIRTPANAWSNLAFCLVGLIILRRELKLKSKFLIGYGPMVIAVGVLSWFYHASLTRIGEIGDLASMFLIGNFLMVTNMERARWLPISAGRAVYWMLNIVSVALLFWIKDLGAPLFFVQCMVALYLELKLRKEGKGPDSYKYFLYSFFSWVIAQTIWVLDIKRIVCNPQLHWIQGHMVWHIFMALLSWFIYLHSCEIRKKFPNIHSVEVY